MSAKKKGPKCKGQVWSYSASFRGRYAPCRLYAVDGDYCNKHNPTLAEERRVAQDAKWNAGWKIHEKERDVSKKERALMELVRDGTLLNSLDDAMASTIVIDAIEAIRSADAALAEARAGLAKLENAKESAK